MPHTESAWRQEIQAHQPQGCDYLELHRQVSDLSDWRVMLVEECGLEESLQRWENHIRMHGIAVPIEQATDVIRAGGNEQKWQR